MGKGSRNPNVPRQAGKTGTSLHPAKVHTHDPLGKALTGPGSTPRIRTLLAAARSGVLAPRHRNTDGAGQMVRPDLRERSERAKVTRAEPESSRLMNKYPALLGLMELGGGADTGPVC